MRLPNGHRAVVEEAKLFGYVLSSTHPVGRHHAVLFNRLLGIHAGNASILEDALLSAARTEEVTRESESAHGHKYEMRFAVKGPAGVKTVRAIWIIDRGFDQPRLVTCYVE